MKKDGAERGKATNKIIAFSEMFLFVSLSFVIAFIISGDVGVVSAQESPYFIWTNPEGTSVAVDQTKPAGWIQAHPDPFLSYDEAFNSLAYEQINKDLSKGISLGDVQVQEPTSKTIPTARGERIGVDRVNVISGANYLSEPVTVGDLEIAAFAQHPGDESWYYVYDSKGVREPNPVSKNVLEKAGIDLKKLPSKGTQFSTGLKAGAKNALAAYFAVQLLAPLLGVEDEEAVSALSAAAAAGFLGAGIAEGLGQTSKAAGWIGVAIFAITFIAAFEKKITKIVTFECLPWEPPIGGDDCDLCNADPDRPCSEYRCRSLGQACELVNVGTEAEACVWKSPNDIVSPIIEPWDGVLGPLDDLGYSDVRTRPPSLGMKIVKGAAGCLPAFLPLQFGITTDEPAQCKIDTKHTDSFEEMAFYFGESNYYLVNHTQVMALPGATVDSATNTGIGSSPILENDGVMTLFVRCSDANGNYNVDEFAVEFCVDPSPDTTPPVVVGSSIPDGSPVQFGVDNMSLDIYVNEIAECRWSKSDTIYENMENDLICDSQNINADRQYVCNAQLTGIVDRQDNKFYFRCKDQPLADDINRNVMVQSKLLTFRGTQPLNIIDVKPNGTMVGSTTTVDVEIEVETDDGADEGIAICTFSESGEEGTFIEMFETRDFKHRQTVSLDSGIYDYFIRCTDAGGNSADANVTFSVFVDKQPPIVTRFYKQVPDSLKIVTHEDAQCTYSFDSCNFVFDEGLQLIYSNPSIMNVHFVEWAPGSIYYIKCKDEFGNEPSPNECSAIVSAVEVSD